MFARSLLVEGVRSQPDKASAKAYLAKHKQQFITSAKNSIPDPNLPDDVVQLSVGEVLNDIETLFGRLEFEPD